ncbi:MAG: hypothetical protein FJY85_17645 [Deltaproteobacteria bacterium]|nr:hypothetical protein [Deltaproteobacteria bacterium]
MLHVLSDDQLQKIFVWLKEGRSVWAIRAELQDEWGLLCGPDENNKAVERAIRVFHKRTIGLGGPVRTKPGNTRGRETAILHDEQSRQRKVPGPYDPLHERIALIQRLCGEYETWSRQAKHDRKSDPYVAKILGLLKETLKDTENLLDRLDLLAPQESSPTVEVDMSLIQRQIGNTDEFAQFVSRINRELSQIAVPISGEHASELQSQTGGPGTGSSSDMEVFEGAETDQATGSDPRIVLEANTD